MMPALRVVSLCSLILVPICAEAQDPPAPFINVEGLPTVFLLDNRGAEYRGKLTPVDEREVVLRLNDGERRFTLTEIVRIEKRGDPLKNGAIIGGITGVVLWLLAAGISDCPTPSQGGCAGARVGVFFTSIGLYTAVGTGIDAAIKGRSLLYEAPTARRGINEGALQFRIRW